MEDDQLQKPQAAPMQEAGTSAAHAASEGAPEGTPQTRSHGAVAQESPSSSTRAPGTDDHTEAPPPARSFLLMLVAVAAVSPLGINLYLPSMPGMATALGVDFAAIQVTLSVYLGAVAVAQLVVGPLSDRYGRRPVLLAGLALFVVGSIMCTLAPNMTMLNLGRIVQAFGGCTGLALSRAVVRDLYSRAQAASMIGYITMGMSVAPMIAPTIGGLLEAIYGWRASFAFLGLFGLATLIVTFRLLHETNKHRGKGGAGLGLLGGYKVLVGNRTFWGYALTAALSSTIFFAFVAGASYVVINLMGRGPIEYGLYFGLVSAGYLVGNFFSARYAMKVGPRRLIIIGAGLTVAALVIMCALFGVGLFHPASLFVPTMFATMGNGLVLPSCIAGAVSVRPEAAGAASGLTGSMQIGFGAIIAPGIGAMVENSAWPMLLAMLACALIARLTFLLTEKPRH